MTSNIDKIRMRVFKIWFVTLAVTVLVFVEKLSGFRNLALPFSSTFQSFQIMMGIIIPQITIMSGFYFNLDKQKEKINSLSHGQITAITYCSIAYHLILIGSVLFGIGFYGFDNQADGESLQRNTAAVVGIIGLFSPFLGYMAFLFSRPNDNKTAPTSGSDE